MNYTDDYNDADSDSEWTESTGELAENLDRVLNTFTDPGHIFVEFTRLLEDEFDIRKGFLALREGAYTRFIAVATWNDGKVRKNLSLRLPATHSLFEKVVEDGQVYSETFAELFDGSMFERRLLLDDETESFMLRPLKYEGQVIALLGYGSVRQHAFVTFEDGPLDPLIDRFAALIATCLPAKSHQ